MRLLTKMRFATLAGNVANRNETYGEISMALRLSLLFGAVLVAIRSPPITAQEYSNGGKGARGRKAATLTPVEAFGVHPPGVDPADSRRWCGRLRQRFVPYYAPLSPVASTARWRPWGYYPLLPYYTPYYPGYGTHRLFNAAPRPYGSDGWGRGPGPEGPLPPDDSETPLGYAGFTSVLDDDTVYWNMGGNGLVPYGADQPPTDGLPDLVDAIQSSRPRRGARAHCHQSHIRRLPAIVTPVETAGEREGIDGRGLDRSSHRRTTAESIPPGNSVDQ
jgi:hypothetical protein